MSRNLFVLLSVCLFAIVSANAQTEKEKVKINVPDGKYIMTDTKCETDEWADSLTTDMGRGFSLLSKKTADHVFLCVKPQKEDQFTADLYLSPADKKLYTLHVSAKLGERILEGEKWADWAVDSPWWRIEGWTATPLRPNNFQERTFFPQEAIEFQISRKRFAGKSWLAMIKISGERVTFPSSADNLKSETWAELVL